MRNSRHTSVPDLLTFARLAYEAGADGITVHPRPDERHIRSADVLNLAELMRPWRPQFELNVEGYPDDCLMDIVGKVRPEQCTLVPDAPTAFTSEESWKLDNTDTSIVMSAVAALKALDCRVVVFLDPNPNVVSRVPGTGAHGVEIYTGLYAAAHRRGQSAAALKAWVDTARAADRKGLVINAGHDLNLSNLPALVRSFRV